MGTCRICQNASPEISAALGLCGACIAQEPGRARKIARAVHARSRRQWGLPETPPRDPDGAACCLCVNRCRISEGKTGACGLRHNDGGKIVGVGAKRGNLSWYHDPLPTNCVGDWICPGGTGCGYPRYAHRDGPEHGFSNLAVFCHACTFNCLYCQNWHFRRLMKRPAAVTVDALAGAVTDHTACICYFGGDPTPQLPFLLAVSKKATEDRAGGILRICWETNGAMAPSFLPDLTDTALSTGGCIKFDLKAFDEALHIALTGVSNRQTLDNFRRLAKMVRRRRQPPPLIASTLMVPGYVDAAQVGKIAAFIASLDPHIPYSLLAFHPQHEMADLAPTSRKEAQACLVAARQAGLKRIRIGNQHLLR